MVMDILTTIKVTRFDRHFRHQLPLKAEKSDSTNTWGDQMRKWNRVKMTRVGHLGGKNHML